MARHQDNARERVLDGFEDLLITNGEFRKLCEFYQSVICIARAHALQ